MIDILIPTFNRPAALAVTLATLVGQTFRDFRVIISDQSEGFDVAEAAEVQAVAGVLRFHGHTVDIHKHLPRLGMAEQRQFLLDQAAAPYVLFLDDDLILEADAVQTMFDAIREERCGFVGCAVPSTKYLHDVRPHQQQIEFWEGRVQPEAIRPNTPEWDRVRLHSAANILHVAAQLGLSGQDTRRYKVSWIGACVMFDRAKLHECGGFSFWEQLPSEHSGEDVMAQVNVMARYGGCGLIPTRAYHQLVPTTVVNRTVDAPHVLLSQLHD